MKFVTLSDSTQFINSASHQHAPPLNMPDPQHGLTKDFTSHYDGLP